METLKYKPENLQANEHLIDKYMEEVIRKLKEYPKVRSFSIGVSMSGPNYEKTAYSPTIDFEIEKQDTPFHNGGDLAYEVGKILNENFKDGDIICISKKFYYDSLDYELEGTNLIGWFIEPVFHLNIPILIEKSKY